MKKVILASGSPRRRELLAQADIKHTLCFKNIDETVPEGLTPEQGVEYIAEKKTEPIAAANPDAIVVGADTIVLLDNMIFGKPVNEDDAQRMLSLLSGKEHKVITGVCLALGDRKVIFHETSTVKFYKLDREEIQKYVRSGEPMDKAGAYGIQGRGCTLVERVDGDFYNIVGLPVARVAREIKKLRAEFPDAEDEKRDED